jgi:hypothetical protein
MEPGIERKVVCVTPEDHKFIEELYKKIINEYKTRAALAGIKPTIGKKGKGPKIRHVISFLREHSVYGDREIQNFAARFVK